MAALLSACLMIYAEFLSVKEKGFKNAKRL
jgi:hypothetical protein